MINLKLEELVKRYQPILTDSIDELVNITSDNTLNKFEKAEKQERLIASKDEKIKSLKDKNSDIDFDSHHGDLIDETINIFIDVKISSDYTWGAISQTSINNFNYPWENPNYFYLTIGLESRSAVFIQHAYLKQLIDENKINYVYTASGIFIGINAISKLINGSLYDPNRIIEFKF